MSVTNRCLSLVSGVPPLLFLGLHPCFLFTESYPDIRLI